MLLAGYLRSLSTDLTNGILSRFLTIAMASPIPTEAVAISPALSFKNVASWYSMFCIADMNAFITSPHVGVSDISYHHFY